MNPTTIPATIPTTIPTTRHRAGAWRLALVSVLVAALAARAHAQAQDRPAPTGTAAERQARGEEAAKNFVQGRYEEALAIYADLYVKSNGRPEYLRNIARCQQKLRRYDRAIDSFNDYLRLAKHLTADEKKEVQGFIAEMKTALANDTKAAAADHPMSPAPAGTVGLAPPAPVAAGPGFPTVAPTTTTPPPPAAATLTATPAEPVPPNGPGATPPPGGAAALTTTAPTTTAGAAAAVPVLISRPVADAPPNHPPTRAMKVTGIVVLVAAALLAVGGVVMEADAWSKYHDATHAGCPASGTDCDQKASSVASSQQASQFLYVGGGIAGAAGLTLLLLAPSPASDGRLALGARFSF